MSYGKHNQAYKTVYIRSKKLFHGWVLSYGKNEQTFCQAKHGISITDYTAGKYLTDWPVDYLNMASWTCRVLLCESFIVSSTFQPQVLWLGKAN